MTPLIAAAVQVCMAVMVQTVTTAGDVYSYPQGYERCPDLMAKAERDKIAELKQRHDADESERQGIYRRALRDLPEGK